MHLTRNARFLTVVLALAVLMLTAGVAQAPASASRPVSSTLAGSAKEPGGGDDIRASEEWFFGQRAYPAKHTPDRALVRATRQAKALRESPGSGAAVATSLHWTGIGPQPIGRLGPAVGGSATFVGAPPVAGRVTAIAPDPRNSAVAYVGGANGGVWKTGNAGGTWSPRVPNNQPSFAIGSIAVDPANPSRVGAGTGGPNSSQDSYYGAGIFRSANGGQSWTKVGGARFDGCFVADLAIVDSSTVVAAVTEFPGKPNPSCSVARRGVWRTTNGGSTWRRIPLPSSQYEAPTDFSQAPGSPSTIYLATFFDGVYKSINGGRTWTKMAVPSGSPYRGVVSAFNSKIVYAAYSGGPTGESLGGVLKTVDGGAHWSTVVPARNVNTPCTYPNDSYGQCSYDIALAVDPSDSTRFFLGGIRMFRYTNSGATGRPVGYGRCSACMHVDQHVAVYDEARRLWIGNDGGVYRTDNAGASFINRNGTGSAALAITEFNPGTSGSIAQGTFLGGTQDNGTVRRTATGGLDWRQDLGGDGGATAYVSPSTAYGGFLGPDLYKTTNGGSAYSNVSGPWGAEVPRTLAYPPLEMSPQSTSTLYRGTSRIWRTTNGALSWSPISPNYPTAVSPRGPAGSPPDVISAGWAGGGNSPAQPRYTTNATAAVPTWKAVPA